MAAPPGGDLVARLYLALSAAAGGEQPEAVAAFLDGADAEAMRRASEWEQRHPPDDGAAPTGEEPYATRGLTTLHVLARDSADVAAVGRGIDLAGPEALATAGGFYASSGKPAAWLPIHLAARYNSSPEVVQKLLDQGGVEQLQAKDQHGNLPIHSAVRFSSSPEVVEKLLDHGGVEQLQATDRDGMLPIHYAAARNSSPEVVLQCIIEAGGVEQLQVETKDGSRPIHFARSRDAFLVLLAAGGVVDDSVRAAQAPAMSKPEFKALIDTPPESAAELLAVCNSSSLHVCASIIEVMQHQARHAGLSDQAMRSGTHLVVGDVGEAVYVSWERKRVGANLHHVRFFGGSTGSQPIKLRSLGPQQWSVVPLPHPQLCHARQLLAFTRGAIGDSGAHHSDMPYDVLAVICALVVAMKPSPSVIDRFVEDKPCCVPRPQKQQPPPPPAPPPQQPPPPPPPQQQQQQQQQQLGGRIACWSTCCVLRSTSPRSRRRV